ncbi:MAG TPA: hypothetical protein VLD58_09480, partial [Gemmatimonadales bacterium]|nr:hypothetical protein [Gemmatimonadales bacterium]
MRLVLRWGFLILATGGAAWLGGRSWLRARRAGPLHLSAVARDSLGPAGPCTLEPRAERSDCYRAALT